MESLLIVLNELPYKTDKAYNALRMAGVAADNGTKVVVFLMGDSIYVARKDHSPPENFPNLEEMVIELMNKGVKFKLCTTCVNARGFEPKEGEVSSCFIGSKADGGLTPGDLIYGSEMSTMVDFVILVDVSEKVISF
ncbi:MAG: DsrE family protein [Actinomycetota bacterium]|nr:DsrE family protein [Actinomycetota bacterium]